jgi:hypothetical protein
MRIFGPVVQSFVLPVLHARQDLAFRSPITLQLIGNDHTWHIRQSFEELAEKSLRSMLIASALNQDIEHIPSLLHRSPERVFFSTNAEHHLVQMPFVATARATTQFIGVGLPKFEAPLPDGFRGDDDASLCQKLFNITKTEGETEIQPDTVTDNFRREAKAFLLGGRLMCFHEAILSHCSATSSS